MRRYSLYSALAVYYFLISACQSNMDISDHCHTSIIPGYAVGQINLFTDRQDISGLYTCHEIHDTWVSPVIGWKYPVTSVLEDGEIQFDIVWDMGVYYSGEFAEEVHEREIEQAPISFIRVYSSKYQGPNGIRTGMDLIRVEELLGRLRLFELSFCEYQEVYSNTSENVSLVFSCTEQENTCRGIRYWNHEITSDHTLPEDKTYTLEYIDIQMEDSLLFLSRDPANTENSHEKQGSIETGPPEYTSVDTPAICIEQPGLCSMEMLQEPVYDGYSYRPCVWIYVKEDGTAVDNVVLMNSCGIEIIDSAAVSAARNSRWLPAVKDGMSVGAWTVLVFDLMNMDE